MFKSAEPGETAQVARTGHQWGVGNRVRGALLLAVLLALLHGLLRLATGLTVSAMVGADADGVHRAFRASSAG